MEDWEKQERLKDKVFNNDIYYRSLTFMVDAMNRDANSKEAEELRTLNNSWNLINKKNALLKFKTLVSDNAEWDYKPDLAMRGQLHEAYPVEENTKLYLFPIPGDKTYLYYYDVWSNLHFGYVSLACGFSGGILYAGATYHDVVTKIDASIEDRSLQPVYDLLLDSPDDNLKIDIGFEVYKNSKGELKEATVTDALQLYSVRLTRGVSKFALNDIRL